MLLNNLGNKQTIVLPNCEINNESYDLVITPQNKQLDIFAQDIKQ